MPSTLCFCQGTTTLQSCLSANFTPNFFTPEPRIVWHKFEPNFGSQQAGLLSERKYWPVRLAYVLTAVPTKHPRRRRYHRQESLRQLRSRILDSIILDRSM